MSNRKFKLIKSYPGSLELGSIIEPLPMNWNVYEKYSEFWEEIKEPKTFEILSFAGVGTLIAKLTPNGTYSYEDLDQCKEWTLDEMIVPMKDSGFPIIYSVKRLSDGEIFTLGDCMTSNTSDWSDRDCFISAFKLTDDKMFFEIKQDKMKSFYLLSLTKYKHKPILISEEGIKLYEGDECFLVFTTRWDYTKTNMRKELSSPTSYMKYFANEDKARAFCYLHKPLYSRQDVLNCFKGYTHLDGKPCAYIALSDLQKMFDGKEK